VTNPFDIIPGSQIRVVSKSTLFKGDKDSPLSFKEWKSQTLVATEQEASYLYNQYLSEWFLRTKNSTVTVNQGLILRQKYLYLLSQLKLFFNEEEKESWYARINLSDEKELLLSIPFFAKKLKSIALYYANLRKKLKNVKIKYNQAGSHGGLEKEIQQYLLELFAAMEEDADPTLKRALPIYSEVKDTLKVEIEELYDGTTYFDRSTTMPVSAYFDFFHDATAELFQTKGITLSSDEWIFKTFDVPVTADLTTFVEQLTGQIFEQTDISSYQSFVQKYIAGNRISTNFFVPSSQVVFNDILINSGDNYFYYPYGTTNENINVNAVILPKPLSSVTIPGATAGDALSSSDVIHVKYGDTIKSAWLYERIFDTNETFVSAKINGGTNTKFMFPFPGFGLSAEDIPWTGKSLSSTPEFKYLTREYKNAVNTAYWSEPLSGDSSVSIFVNNSTLAENGAYPHKHSEKADTIFVRTYNGSERALPFTGVNSCWLYKLDQTSLPIHVSLTEPIIWPYQRVSSELESFPSHLKSFNFAERCEPIKLNNISCSNLVAGSAIDVSERVYKIGRFVDNKKQALECAWLSGSPVDSTTHRWIAQQGFNALFEAGKATRFLWNGANNTPLSSVFKTLYHSEECPLSNLEEAKRLTPSHCTCKQVFYTPKGHPGETFKDNNSQADCVVKEIIDPDQTNPLFSTGIEPFTFSSWIDEKGLKIDETDKFAWYKTKEVIGGYGDGAWFGNNRRVPLTLETGCTYFYVRAASRTVEAPEEDPSLVVHYKHDTTKQLGKVKWMQARIDEEGNWISTDSTSDLTLNAGDFLLWEHPEFITNYILSAVDVEAESSNNGNIWSVLDRIAINSPLNSTVVAWPVDALAVPDELSSSQNPRTSFVDILSVTYWKFYHEETGQTYTFSEEPIIVFEPPEVGVYQIRVQAMDGDGNVITLPDSYTTIPSITVVPQFEKTIELVETQQPVPGAVLEIPLSGWNYDTNTYDGKSKGAQPYWAEKYVGKSPSVNFGGLFDWGYPLEWIQGYLPDSTPKISDITLDYGQVLEYKSLSSSFIWNQPIEYQTYVGTPLWCEIERNTNKPSPLSAVYSIKEYQDTYAKATLDATDIQLSNYIDGSPLEVFYNALGSPFVWSIETDVISDSEIIETKYIAITADQSYNVFSNRNFPTIATIPVAQDLYSKKDVGGFFTPLHLGASNFINKNFDILLVENIQDGSEFLTSELRPAGGRGLTKQQQIVPYTWEDDNQWIKAPFNSGAFAGSVRKVLTKELQTFIPYVEWNGLFTNGLVSPDSRTSPWGEVGATTWTDTQNHPQTFTGVSNFPAWKKTQILKYIEKEVDCWTSDIYGNQYGLYKPLSASPVKDRINEVGELWIKTKEGNVFPATTSLSSIFEPFQNINPTVYSQLTGGLVNVVDCFGDVLFLQTSLAVIFAKILFDPQTLLINTSLDDIRFLISNESNQQKFGQTWYFPKQKKIMLSTVSINNNLIFPELYEIETMPINLTKAFPITEQDSLTLTQELSVVSAKTIENSLLTYNNRLRKYVTTISGQNTSEKSFIVNLVLQHENL
jgi:hypothetical protein